MNCLIDRLSGGDSNDVVWIADRVGEIDVGSLVDVLRRIETADWLNKRVAIGVLSTVEFVSALVFLDGLAESIVLLPVEDDLVTRDTRLDEAGIDLVVEGEGFGVARRLAQRDHAAEGIPHDASAGRPPAIETTWMLPTSGTTGVPKLIPHTFASLTRSMAGRRIGSGFTWGSLYSLRRFAGLQVFLQCWTGATPLILNEEGAELSDVLTRFIEMGCNALSATPSMWRKLAMHPLFDRLSLKQITLGGEIVDQSVLDMLARRFPSARITHIYASTEAGVGFAVRDGLSGFPADYLLHPPSGVGMRIDEQGHLWFGRAGAWIDSGDVVDSQADRVRFLGRANGSINVGGNKVMPEEIESVIAELPEVAFVQVRARKSAILGSLVEAAVTPVAGTELDVAFKKRVTAHCRARLESFKVPAFIVSADAIELTASGKLSRSNSK